LGITDPLGVWIVAVGEAVQEGEDVFRGDLIGRTITELPDESFDDGPVGSYRIFFRMGFVAIDPDFGCFGKSHGLR
jgi:hypothetical protein